MGGSVVQAKRHGSIIDNHYGKTFVFCFAFKTLDISQGSVATHLRCDGIFIDSIITNFLLILTVK